MKLVVEQAALLKAAARATSVVEARNTIPILSNILITAHPGGGASLTATDLDIEITADFAAEVEATGALTVPATLLSEIARNAPKGAEIVLDATGDDPRLQVRFGKSRYQLPVLPAGDFPTFGRPSNAATLDLPGAELLGLLNRVHFAMSSESTRYYLCGARLELAAVAGHPMLRMVSTDGHRLALDETPAAGAPSFPGLTIPRKTALEFRRLLGDLQGPVQLSVSPTSIALKADGLRLISKALDGSFPDYSRVIPTALEREIVLERDLFSAAIKRVVLISNEKARTLKLSIADGVMTLSARNSESGGAAEEIEIDDDGPSFEIGFNAKYVIDALDQSDGKRVVLKLPDSNAAPARLDPHPEDKAAAGALCVLMPLRV